MAISRFAESTWQGSLLEGSGTIDYVSSGAFTRLPVTWASRTEEHNGRTSPEELIAAARKWPRRHASGTRRSSITTSKLSPST